MMTERVADEPCEKCFVQITVPASMVERYEADGYKLVAIMGHDALVRRYIRHAHHTIGGML